MSDSGTHQSTTPCPVKLHLVDGTEIDGTVWLLNDSGRAEGVVPLDVLLDGTRDFLAVGLQPTGSVLISRNAIRTAEIAADGPGVHEVLDAGASLDMITLHLDDGHEVTGVLRAVAREGFARMSDVINEAGRFLSVGVGDQVVLVAKTRVVRISF